MARSGCLSTMYSWYSWFNLMNSIPWTHNLILCIHCVKQIVKCFCSYCDPLSDPPAAPFSWSDSLASPSDSSSLFLPSSNLALSSSVARFCWASLAVSAAFWAADAATSYSVSSSVSLRRNDGTRPTARFFYTAEISAHTCVVSVEHVLTYSCKWPLEKTKRLTESVRCAHVGCRGHARHPYWGWIRTGDAEKVPHALKVLRRVCVLPNPYWGGTHHVRIPKSCPRFCK